MSVTGLQWPPELGSAKTEGSGGTGGLQHWVQFEGSSFKGRTPTCDIALFIPPDALSTGYKSEYENIEGMTGSNFSAYQKAKNDPGTDTAVLATAITEGWFKGLTQGGQWGKMATDIGQKGLGMVGGEAMESVMSAARGKSVNPYIVAAYKGPTQLRNHKFTFNMMPRSSNESKTVQKIVKAFKMAMHPDHDSPSSDAAPIGMFNYPDEFEITFYINGQPLSEKLGADETNPLFRIGRSVLSDMSLDYTTQDTVAFFEGSSDPVSVNMTLEFQELSVIHRKLVKEGF